MFVTSLMMSTLYNCGSYLDLVSHKFEMGANIAIKWLKNNQMVADLKKFQLMLLARNENIEKKMSFAGKTRSSNTVELLSIT